MFFRGRGTFSGCFCFKTFFLSIFVVALVERLSVRGTQKRDKKCYGVVCLIFFPGKGRPKNKQKTRESRSVVFTWDCVFLAYFVKTCCTSF
jgi:hypothetical protein